MLDDLKALAAELREYGNVVADRLDAIIAKASAPAPAAAEPVGTLKIRDAGPCSPDVEFDLADNWPTLPRGVALSLYAAPLPGGEGRDELRVSVCWPSDGDDPFVFAVHGNATVAVLQEIEADLTENRETLANGPGEYTFSARQCEGDEAPPYWELDIKSFALTAAGKGE